MSYFHSEPLIDTVTERSVLGDIARLDGTAIVRCDAVYRDAKPTLVESVIHEGWLWTVEKFSDGSRRLYATGPNGEISWLDGYPVSPREYIEDIEGVPDAVLDELDATWIPRVRASFAHRAHHWIHGQGGQNVPPALVIDRGVPGQTFAVVFSDGSALGPGGYPVDDWEAVIDGVDAEEAARLTVTDVAPGHEELADAVRRAIERAAASA